MTQDEILRGLREARSKASTNENGDTIPFSGTVLERAQNPFGLGDIPDPDGYAFITTDCGDSMEVFLTVKNHRILMARFHILGCVPTIACGSMAMELAEGRTVLEALQLRPEHIIEALGGIPQSHFHCAELAAQTLKKAIDDYLIREKDPWKKLYPRS